MVLPTTAAGLYIHIPFCIRKCPYCDFFSITDRSRIDPLVQAMVQEIQWAARTVPAIDTIYLGGGTPSVLSPEHLDRILHTVYDHFTLLPDNEITLEINPGTVTKGHFSQYRDMGINRINIGVQSFSDTNLGFLGRIHNASQAIQCVQWALSAGFSNIGLDLIYGLPRQNARQWESDLLQAINFLPHHLSCYTLTLEPGTPMHDAVMKNQIPAPNDESVAELFLQTKQILENAGYSHYEISNYARSDRWMSRHNRKYWQSVAYIGVGPSAHSFIQNQRIWNHPDVDAYIRDVSAHRPPIAGKETLTLEQQLMEALYLGFRQSNGIDGHRFFHRFGTSLADVFPSITALINQGIIQVEANEYRLSRKGMLYLDSIVAMLVREMEIPVPKK